MPVLIVCAERVYHSFISFGIYSLQTVPHGDRPLTSAFKVLPPVSTCLLLVVVVIVVVKTESCSLG